MTRVIATASFKTLWKSGLFWSRNPPRTDNESSKISKLRMLFMDIVPCGSCVAVFLPILAWVSSIHCSNIYLILVSEETASAMVCTSLGTLFRCFPNIVESRSRTSRNLQREVVGVISLTAPAAVSVTNTVFPSTHTAVGCENKAAKNHLMEFPCRILQTPLFLCARHLLIRLK